MLMFLLQILHLIFYQKELPHFALHQRDDKSIIFLLSLVIIIITTIMIIRTTIIIIIITTTVQINHYQIIFEIVFLHMIQYHVSMILYKLLLLINHYLQIFMKKLFIYTKQKQLMIILN